MYVQGLSLVALNPSNVDGLSSRVGFQVTYQQSLQREVDAPSQHEFDRSSPAIDEIEVVEKYAARRDFSFIVPSRRSLNRHITGA